MTSFNTQIPKTNNSKNTDVSKRIGIAKGKFPLLDDELFDALDKEIKEEFNEEDLSMFQTEIFTD